MEVTRLVPFGFPHALGTERARVGTFRGFGTERARLGTFRGFGTERARLGTFNQNVDFRTFASSFHLLLQGAMGKA